MANSQQLLLECTRRELFKRSGLGIGSAALATLLAEDLGFADESLTLDSAHRMAPRATHFPARAKNVIFLHMVGAPSQLDLFEDKPVLRENDDKPCPDHLLEGQRFAFLRGHPKLMGSSFKFKRHGESGQVFSELLPHLSTMADDIAILKTLHTEQFNHAPAQLFMQTGFPRFGRPCIASWAS